MEASGTVLMRLLPSRTSSKRHVASDGQSGSPGYVLHFGAAIFEFEGDFRNEMT